jgi:hypothetical protein
MTNTDPARVAAIRNRLEKATYAESHLEHTWSDDGEDHSLRDDSRGLAIWCNYRDAELYKNAPGDLAWLLTQLDRAEAERDELRTSRDILEAKLTDGTTSLRNAASLLEDPSVIATAGLYLTSAQHSQIVREFAQVKAERDEAQAGARTIILEYDRLRASLAAAREALERIAKRPDLPNPERDADWKACMKLSAQEARAALTSIGAQAVLASETASSKPRAEGGKGKK